MQNQHKLSKEELLFRKASKKTLVFFRNGQVVGYLRRGGFGYTINQGLGTGYVDLKAKPEGQSVKDFVLSGSYHIEVMGQQYPAQVSLTPLYDPKKLKMKLN